VLETVYGTYAHGTPREDGVGPDVQDDPIVGYGAGKHKLLWPVPMQSYALLDSPYDRRLTASRYGRRICSSSTQDGGSLISSVMLCHRLSASMSASTR
jgi:hypothetical protein